MASLHKDPNKNQSSKQSEGIEKGRFRNLEFSLKKRAYQELLAYCQRKSLTLEDGVSSLIERGIDNYWLMAYKSLKHDFIMLKENFETYKRDNKLLTAIEAQNEELKSQLLKKGIPNQVLATPSKKENTNKAGELSVAKELADKEGESEAARMSLAVREETAAKLKQFLIEKGFFVTDAVPVLIEYGLASQDEYALMALKEEREKELPKMDAEYAALRFRAYQYFKVNQTITIRLYVLLSENRRLKELCQLHGICIAAQDPWDDWGSDKINELYGRYVFVNRV
ncbi:MAG: hypothetical protein NQU41_01330 [Candidatus Methanosuratincola sp.]|uniref:Uncharacterized protein n=1 Tax=Methanosuratincola subterraneus TaxID=2593994 RepID=A0A3S4UGI4_METS7|nr:hypothetical protein [Candidatus Methanosuratincola sp.]RWX73400.1 MAG: hypothetical protein Metus_1374 [Candidatus Methanosuratincola subterraneus]